MYMKHSVADIADKYSSVPAQGDTVEVYASVCLTNVCQEQNSTKLWDLVIFCYCDFTLSAQYTQKYTAL